MEQSIFYFTGEDSRPSRKRERDRERHVETRKAAQPRPRTGDVAVGTTAHAWRVLGPPDTRWSRAS